MNLNKVYYLTHEAQVTQIHEYDIAIVRLQ